MSHARQRRALIDDLHHLGVKGNLDAIARELVLKGWRRRNLEGSEQVVVDKPELLVVNSLPIIDVQRADSMLGGFIRRQSNGI